jgi:sugar lactone lactonase YvrE
MTTTTVLAAGLAFPEGPRWHDGRLWFSDMYSRRVKTVGLDGTVEDIVEVPGRPSGLGWRPDGTVLVVSMTERRLLAYDGHRTSSVADLSTVCPGDCNDMVVDRQGRAYVGNFGAGDGLGSARRPTVLAMVEPDGRVAAVADDMHFPNGMVLTEDGSSLIVAESNAQRLTQFRVAPDGTLHDRSVFAALGDVRPDGICLDRDGAVWTATIGPEVIRVRRGGAILERVTTGAPKAFACMLGGNERRTLFVCTAAPPSPPAQFAAIAEAASGKIETAKVAVAGAGLP